MGILSFFKGKRPVETEVQVKEIRFDEIDKWLEEMEDAFGSDEQRTLEKIGERLGEFYVSIESKLKVLEVIDIESKKEHGRAKLLVRQGLDSYVNSVKALIRDLKNIEMENVGKFALEVSKLFGHFEKSSAIFYGRANYLVGDEMAAVRNEIRKFYNGLVEIFEGDKSPISNLKSIGEVRLKFREFSKGQNNLKENNEEIEKKNVEIDKLKKNVEKLMKEIEKMRGGSEYVSNLKTEDEIKALRIKIDKESVKLKDIIDFKKLTQIVHSNERELRIVKEHKEHFVTEFSHDGGEKIVALLEGSNMKNSEIDAQLSLIKKMNEGLKEKTQKVGLDPTIVKFQEVKRIEDEIDNLETEKVRIRRRMEDLDLKLQGLKNEVINLIEGFGVKVV